MFRTNNLEALAASTDHLPGQQQTARINAHFRAIDQSHLWPVCNKFDATERAIRRLSALRRSGCGPADGIEYVLALDIEISNIVNGEV